MYEYCVGTWSQIPSDFGDDIQYLDKDIAGISNTWIVYNFIFTLYCCVNCKQYTDLKGYPSFCVCTVIYYFIDGWMGMNEQRCKF